MAVALSLHHVFLVVVISCAAGSRLAHLVDISTSTSRGLKFLDASTSLAHKAYASQIKHTNKDLHPNRFVGAAMPRAAVPHGNLGVPMPVNYTGLNRVNQWRRAATAPAGAAIPRAETPYGNLVVTRPANQTGLKRVINPWRRAATALPGNLNWQPSNAGNAARALPLLTQARGAVTQPARTPQYANAHTPRVNDNWNGTHLNIRFGQPVKRLNGPLLPYVHYGNVANNYQPTVVNYVGPQGVGFVSGNWRVIGPLGEASPSQNADLYKVVNTQTGKEAALKVAKVQSPQAIPQIHNEKNVMLASKRQKCLGLIEMLDGNPTVSGLSVNPMNAVVITLMDGGDFEKWMQKSPDQRCVAKVIKRIGYALQCLHKTGYIHMDFHPAQVLLGKPNPGQPCPSDVRLIDYGMAAHKRKPVPLLPGNAWDCCGQYVDSVIACTKPHCGDSLRLKSPQHPGSAQWSPAVDYCAFQIMVQQFGYGSPLNKMNVYCGMMGVPRTTRVYI